MGRRERRLAKKKPLGVPYGLGWTEQVTGLEMSSDLLEIRLEEFLLDFVIGDDLIPVEPASAGDAVDDIE